MDYKLGGIPIVSDTVNLTILRVEQYRELWCKDNTSNLLMRVMSVLHKALCRLALGINETKDRFISVEIRMDPMITSDGSVDITSISNAAGSRHENGICYLLSAFELLDNEDEDDEMFCRRLGVDAYFMEKSRFTPCERCGSRIGVPTGDRPWDTDNGRSHITKLQLLLRFNGELLLFVLAPCWSLNLAEVKDDDKGV